MIHKYQNSLNQIQISLENLVFAQYIFGLALDGKLSSLPPEKMTIFNPSDLTDKVEFVADYSNIDNVKSTAHNNLMIAIGACCIVCNTSLEDVFGKHKELNNPNDNVACLRHIMYQARCAYGHRLTKPIWEPSKGFADKSWTVNCYNKCITLDLLNKTGVQLSPTDFGGVPNLIRLVKFTQDIIQGIV